MTGQILTFTNLFPSSARPHHGRFVLDRMRRVAAHSGLCWQVVSPVPRVPWPLRRGEARRLAALPAREEFEGVAVHHVPYFHLPGLSLARQAARIARAAMPVVRELARGVPTVLDAHYAYPDGVAAARIASQLGLPCAVTARGTDVNVLASSPAVRRQMCEAFAGVAHLFAVSGELVARFAEVVGPGRVRLARNGVDLEVFRPGDRAAARAALGLPDRPLVLGVGRLVETKGFHHAAAALPADATLVLVGEGPEERRIAALLPADRVVFLGSRSRDDVVLAYQACDLLVLPTLREGWPNVVTEALACGLPVVASAVGGIPEILADAAVGALVPPGDEAALRAALHRFLRSPPDPVQVRALAARYSWDATVEMLSTLFQSAVA